MPHTARPQNGRALACVLGPAEGSIGATGAAGGRTPAEAGDRDLSSESASRFVPNYVRFDAVSVVIARRKEKINQKLINVN
jgi:hypothetical protein